MDKLKLKRSQLPAITHVDYSARVQTVHESTNPRYYRLLRQFEALTRCGVLINTSFNVRGEPIVCTATDAYRCFMRTEMDYLVIENFLLSKAEQPPWPGRRNGKRNSCWTDERSCNTGARPLRLAALCVDHRRHRSSAVRFAFALDARACRSGVALGARGGAREPRDVVPSRLRLLYRGWMRFGLLMSKVTTPLIMAAVFFVVISPIGLLRRLAGFGSFDKGPAKDMLTYRVPARQPGASDLDRPY